MDKKDFIIQKGDLAKWQLTIEHEDFDQQRDDFYVVVHFGMSGKIVRLNREQILHDEDGSWFVVIPTTDMTGLLKAETHYFVPDSDVSGGLREELDWQYIAFVTADPCPKFACKPCKCEADGHVSWKRVYRGDVRTLYLNLRTSEQQPILDGEGRQIRVRKEDKDIY